MNKARLMCVAVLALYISTFFSLSGRTINFTDVPRPRGGIVKIPAYAYLIHTPGAGVKRLPKKGPFGERCREDHKNDNFGGFLQGLLNAVNLSNEPTYEIAMNAAFAVQYVEKLICRPFAEVTVDDFIQLNVLVLTGDPQVQSLVRIVSQKSNSTSHDKFRDDSAKEYVVKLLQDLKAIQKEGKIHPIEVAGYAHQMLIKECPLREANGETIRLFTNLILMQAGYLPVIFFSESEYYAMTCGNSYMIPSFCNYLCKCMIDTYYRYMEKGFGHSNNCACDLCAQPDLKHKIRSFMLTCQNCEKTVNELQEAGLNTDSLKYCSNCQMVRYCSPECQKADWKLHKRFCGDPISWKTQDVIMKKIVGNPNKLSKVHFITS